MEGLLYNTLVASDCHLLRRLRSLDQSEYVDRDAVASRDFRCCAIVADMVRQEERGFAMAMLTLGVLMGPVIGPVTGGFLAAAKGWRWVFWVISMVVSMPSPYFPYSNTESGIRWLPHNPLLGLLEIILCSHPPSS